MSLSTTLSTVSTSLNGLGAVTTAATALSNLILVSPNTNLGYQPQNTGLAANPPAILFHYEGEQTAMLESDITDHYVEDNTAIQDQIALRPETITTHGFIGELNDIAPPALAIAQSVANKLTVINAYTPVLSATAILAYNNAFQLYQNASNGVNSAVSAWSSITGSGSPSQNKQQTAFQQFYGYWKSRTLFTVQTPWAVFQNMAIKSLRAIQSAETNVITDFEVTFKMMRFASTTPTLPTTTQGRFTNQAADLVNNGTQTPSVGVGFSPTYSVVG